MVRVTPYHRAKVPDDLLKYSYTLNAVAWLGLNATIKWVQLKTAE